MKQASILREALQPGLIPWALQLKAISKEEPCRLVRTLSGAILGCGGWILSRSAADEGVIDILFEFERHSCLEIYSLLIAAGLELDRSAHLRFTELCQCVRLARNDSGDEIVSIELEVRTSPMEPGELFTMPGH